MLNFRPYHDEKRKRVMVNIFDEFFLKTTCQDANSVFLDVGCRAGWYTTFMARKNRFVVGIDLSSKSIQQAKERAPKANFILCDANVPPFKENTFDLIIAAQFLEHMTDPNHTISCLGLLAKRGSYIVFEVPSSSNIMDYVLTNFFRKKLSWGLSIDPTHKHFFSQAELEQLFHKCGLKLVKVVGAVHMLYVLPVISWAVWGNGKRFWILLDLLEKFLGALKGEWDAIQIYILKRN